MKDARCCVIARSPTARYTGCSRKRYDTRFSKPDRNYSLCLIDPQMTLSCRTRSALVWAALSFAIGGICNRIIIRLVAFGGLAAFSHFVSAADLTGQVTLAQALALTLKQNPDGRKAGKASAVEQTCGEVSVVSARIEVDQAKTSLITARQHLAAHWGSAQPKLAQVDGDLQHVTYLPSLANLSLSLAPNPEV